MIKLRRADIEISKPFGSIAVSSVANEQLSLICFSEPYSLEVIFDSFLGLENREEFFDHFNAGRFIFEKIVDQIWNFPISWCPVEEFEKDLSVYESTQITSETKLWVFLSMSNCVEVYSNEQPIIRI